MSGIGTTSLAIGELREFAGFLASEQRYIKRSLDIALGRGDALRLWARDPVEAAAIHDQYVAYRVLPALRRQLRDDGGARLDGSFARLVALTAADLAGERLATFSAYRFLYERLLGAGVRPWLPAAFCSAAALPQLHPELRRKLLQSISEAAATASGWSNRQPAFFPHWVEKVEMGALPN